MKRIIIIYCIFLGLNCFSQNLKPSFSDVGYCQDTLSKHLLDVYIPEGKNKMAPCIIWIHGGGWGKGHKAEQGGCIDHLGLLLNKGYVLVSINYRLSQDSIFPACIYDCKAAIRFIKLNATKYGIDTCKIGVAGPSAGGHLASLIGTSGDTGQLEDFTLGNKGASSKIYAVLDLFGPTDFSVMDKNIPSIMPDSCANPLIHNKVNSPESKLLGCNIVECPQLVLKANPISYITSNTPPFMIVHGTFDCLVSPYCSILLNQELKKKNVPSELVLLEHAPHGGRDFKTQDMQTKYLDFFNKALKYN